MKRRGPLERRTPLVAKAQLVRGGSLARTPMARTSGRERKPPARRPSEAPFRAAVMAARGEVCRVCGSTRWVQAAHVWGKGQGGPTRVENGLPLCEPCHTGYDQYKLQLRFEQLDPDQVAWLAEVRYCSWDDGGMTYGKGWRRFAPLTPAQILAQAL